MLERRISDLLALFPRGMTQEQLVWRLRQGGLRPDPSSMLAALTRLTERGEIRRELNRWHLAYNLAAPETEAKQSAHASGLQYDGVLRSIQATLREAGDDENAVKELDEDRASVSWRAALSYYAATQRQDPRGNVERFPDQHGGSWQLIHMSGRWWTRACLTIPVASLPGPFRETLTRAAREGAASIGWPVSVFHGPTGATCLPGLLIPVTWKLKAELLEITPQAVSPSLNPVWLREVRRRTQWSEDALRDALTLGEEASGFEEVSERISHALARIGGGCLRPAVLASDMALGGDGLRNSAGFFLPDEATFTRAVAADLDRLAEWTPETRRGTALAEVFEPSSLATATTAVAEPLDLTDDQFAAAFNALSGPLTVIQGPPGTGKSQTIVSILCSALAQGQSVLFVARNHRAIDEVEQRLEVLLPDLPVLTRGRDADGVRDQGFTDALTSLLEGTTRTPDMLLAAEAARAALLPWMQNATAMRQAQRQRDALGVRLAELVERARAIKAALPEDQTRGELGLWIRMMTLLLRFRSKKLSLDVPLSDQSTLAQVEARIVQLRAEFDALPDTSQIETLPLIDPLRAICRDVTFPDVETQAAMRERKSELEFQPGGLRLAALNADDAQKIVRHRPIWAITSLSVPGRVPLIPKLFDLAVFDEASQCDIASALPVLARTKRAVVVGDPQQLTFIPGLGRAQEHALMDAAEMPRQGRAQWAQSINSLYDFTRRRVPANQVHLLRDQFRSAPEIVDYTNDAFYGGKLIARRSGEEFQPPDGYKPGVHWQDVKGAVQREDGGNINRAEAEWIVQRLVQLSKEAGFDGTVGVISPFNAQVGLIRRLVDAALDEPARRRLHLHVNTVDRWQGGEADFVLFSMVAGRSAPQSAISFLSRERRRFNVAISRARAVAVVVGDLEWARGCGIAHICTLADHATRPPRAPLELSESIWERRMAVALQGRGLAFTQQYAVGRRRLDFALFADNVKLDLEVDGRRWHTGADGNRKTSDRLRDREMISLGWKVRRFWVHELQSDMEGCLDTIERDIGRR
ncbi:AAA domain-containing protein [Roseinatronobacter sp.]|uniref:AAA domain-containing protein n=1 Tax=Roseinatronobacter sp. TaxID=1945755 RepID=UPI0025D6883C|nr:AAA domain-containing protein [Roseibaca sp.]